MFLISYRGNINGSDGVVENHPDQVSAAIKQDYDVYIDAWRSGNAFYLGYLEPKYMISKQFMEKHKSSLWCQPGNQESKEYLEQNGWHVVDSDTSLTSWNFMWSMRKSGNTGIVLLPELTPGDVPTSSLGICSSWVGNLSKMKCKRQLLSHSQSARYPRLLRPAALIRSKSLSSETGVNSSKSQTS